MVKQLSRLVQVQSLVTPTAGAAGATAINGSVIDLQNFEGALIAVHFGAIVAGAVTSIKVQGGDTDTPTTDIAGSLVTVADTDDDTVKVIDVKNFPYRYMRIVISRATQNATVGSALAYIYGARNQPTTQPAGVAALRLPNAAAGTP